MTTIGIAPLEWKSPLILLETSLPMAKTVLETKMTVEVVVLESTKLTVTIGTVLKASKSLPICQVKSQKGGLGGQESGSGSGEGSSGECVASPCRPLALP
jgi:hypothetical protein